MFTKTFWVTLFFILCGVVGAELAKETKLQEEKEYLASSTVKLHERTIAERTGETAVGYATLAIRSDDIVPLAAEDGDYTVLQVDNFGRVWAHCINPPETGRVRGRFESNFP